MTDSEPFPLSISSHGWIVVMSASRQRLQPLFRCEHVSGVAVARAHVLLPVSTHVGPDFYIAFDQIQDTVPLAVVVELCSQTWSHLRRFEYYQDAIVPTKMSGSNQTTDTSTSNLTAIFEAASHEYRTLAREDLETHPFVSALDGYNSPDPILDIFRKQVKAFDKFRKGDDKLMALLSSIVNILFTFSETLGEGVGLVSNYSF